MYKDKDWLKKRYVEELASVESMAKEANCGVPTIRKYLKVFKIVRGKAALVGKPAWNSGLTKNEDSRLKKLSEDRQGAGNPMYGKKAWNSGVSPRDDKRVADMVKAMREGLKKNPLLTREKRRQAKLGKRGVDTNNYIRGYTVDTLGYARISVGEDDFYVHRYMAENILGRKLKSSEHAHHLDGNKLNNISENLIVLSTSAHAALHRYMFPATTQDQLDWLNKNSYEVINLYEIEKSNAA